MERVLKIKRLSPLAVLPKRATDGAAAMDLCAALEKPVLHCHIAERVSRAYPKAGDGTQKEYAEFFGKLKAQGYCGRVSVEGGCEDFTADARAAFAELDGYRK